MTSKTKIQEDAQKPARAPSKAPAGKGRSKASGGSLVDLAEGYLDHLEESGRSESTVFGYRMELRKALKALGEKTTLGALTEKKITAYFESDAVVKSKTGKPLNKLSIAKTRRVLRLALVWASEQGWIVKTPIPATEKKAKSTS